MIWKTSAPHDSPYVTDYRKLAGTIIEGLVNAGAGRRFREASPLAINYRNGKVIVTPDEIVERDDGVIVVRKVRTGKRGKTEFDKLEYSLYQRAAAQNFGPRAVVEAVHPSDSGVEDVPPPKTTKAGKNDTKVEEILAGIAAGMFAPDPDAFRCPRCPHFFICASAPQGPLDIA